MGNAARAHGLSAVIMITLIAGACTSGGLPAPTPDQQSVVRDGGTLRVGLLLSAENPFGNCGMRLCGLAFDPLSYSVQPAVEVAHCCLMRTLLSTNGRSVSEGGTVLRPDLATDLPTISDDGLTWTFHLKRGLRYGPPMTDTEIVAADVVRAIERALTPRTTGGTIGGYFTDLYLPHVIEGARAFADGEATHISGLETPDPHTLAVHLTEPTGDLSYRLSQPQLGPIPANPARPDDPLGVAQDHPFDYGDFIVSSGPTCSRGQKHSTSRSGRSLKFRPKATASPR